jgi:hypothetical protein
MLSCKQVVHGVGLAAALLPQRALLCAAGSSRSACL